MRKLLIRYVNGGDIIWLRCTSSNTQVIRNYSPQGGGMAGTLIFWLLVPGMTQYLKLICPAGTSLQMTGGHNLFHLYARVICNHCLPLPPPRRMSRTSILCLHFPIVNTTLWGQLAGQTMAVLPCSLLLNCTAMVAYVYQKPTFPTHYGDNVKVKSQHICKAIPALLRGLGEAVVTNDCCITKAYDAYHMKI